MSSPKSIINSGFFAVIGLSLRNLKESFRFILRGQIPYKEFEHQLVFLGFECLPMIIALTAIGCMILALNTAVELDNHGGRELTGALIAIADLREILPIFIAFAIGARCGTAMTAETATMKVTEQIDALKVMRTDPIYFILVPRLVSVIILGPFIVAISALTSILAGMLVANMTIGLEFEQFLESAWHALSLEEYFYPLLKTEIFTIYSVLINVSLGLGCEGGAKEVGLATTQATAWVMVGIILLDGILTPILYT